MGIFDFFSRGKKEDLDRGLEKTKQSFFSKITRAILGKSKVDDEVLDNLEEVLKTDPKTVGAIKIFMGSSTGNMLVDNYTVLHKIFSEAELLIATHCETEAIVAANKLNYPNPDHARFHPLIRDVAACYESTLAAIQIAQQYDTRLHVLHISTAKELGLFSNMLPLKDKRITNEVCVHHLHFTADDYERLGNQIKCNPAIKAPENKEALWKALLDDTLDIIATDHAPHTWDEKMRKYQDAPAGLPLVQHGLQILMDFYHQNILSLETIVEKTTHNVAKRFQVKDRGFIREGYYADLVVIDLDKKYQVTKENILYKCAWSPFLGKTFKSSIHMTICNGHIAFEDGQVRDDVPLGMQIEFDR